MLMLRRAARTADQPASANAPPPGNTALAVKWPISAVPAFLPFSVNTTEEYFPLGTERINREAKVAPPPSLEVASYRTRRVSRSAVTASTLYPHTSPPRLITATT